MSDTNLSADKIRTMLAEANERLRKASADYFELLEKGLSSSQLPVANQAKQFCGYMQRNVTATFDLGDRLIQAKDMQDAVKIQSEFFQDQMRSLTDHAKSVGESAMKAATSVLPQRAEGRCRAGRGARRSLCRPDQAWDGYGASISGRLHRQRDQHHDPCAGDRRRGRHCPLHRVAAHRAARDCI